MLVMPAQSASEESRTPLSTQPTADLLPSERRALLAELLRKRASERLPFHPLSDNQQGIWFLCQLAPESAIYNVSFAGRIRSDVDVPAFRRAFQALVESLDRGVLIDQSRGKLSSQPLGEFTGQADRLR